MYERINIFYQRVGTGLLECGWYWHAGPDDYPHGPFSSREEAERDIIDPVDEYLSYEQEPAVDYWR